MSYPFRKKKIIPIILVIFFLGGFFCLAQAGSFDFDFLKDRAASVEKADSEKVQANKKNSALNTLDGMKELAVDYRRQGRKFQESGNLEEAKKFYQSAVIADPFYEVAYNDLGVVLEAQGDNDSAEASYIRALQINPRYLSAYSNLALVYEKKRDFKTAVSLWEARAQLGEPGDPWTEKAYRRVSDLNALLGKKTDSFQEKQVLDLAREQSEKRALIRDNDEAAAKNYFEKAKQHYKREELPAAFKQAINAMQLDPDNREISDFVDKVQLRMLSR